MARVIVIGGGASGMMAAIRAAERGHSVLLLEKNEKLGKKLAITGKGRCNLTNACETKDLFQNVLRNPKFLYSAFYTFSNIQTVDFFESRGLPTKIERGERVFPQSDHSSDVIAVLQRSLKAAGVQLRLHTRVTGILTDPYEQGKASKVTGVSLADGKTLSADAVVLAAGGLSYPATGSTGDGYFFAEALGHEIKKPFPSLVPFEAKENWVKELQGLSLKNVSVRIKKNGQDKPFFEAFGEMLFTHFGVSGPLILSAAAVLGVRAQEAPLHLVLEIDLKPALTLEQVDKRLLREFGENPNRAFKNAVGKLFPGKLLPVMIALSGISGEKKVHELTKRERAGFAGQIKALPVTLTRTRDFKESIITGGGVAVSGIDPSTMESKLVKGLYFAGEVLDVDALTGGFNLQIAWSTGYLAGESIP